MEAAQDLRLDPNNWGDWRWRISNIYTIVDDDGKVFRFRPNPEQVDFMDSMSYLNIILKARQLGFTTLIDLMQLDNCVFNSYQSASIIAHGLDEVVKIFRNKVRFPYEHLPDQIRNHVGLKTDKTTEFVFTNDSSIGVSTSTRSGTMQSLHISEYGKICRKFPDRANEIKTGSLNTVKAGQYIFIESTAEGRDGDFYRLVQQARKVKASSKRLTELDFKFHFYPWFLKKSYRINPNGVTIPREVREYFLNLVKKERIRLDPAQRAWYAKKLEQMGGVDDWEDMKREFPSTPDEAFDIAVRGAIYGKQMTKMREQNRIRKVPHVPTMPVNTFWDLGRGDFTAIWFHQFVAAEHRFINYLHNNLQDLAYYYGLLEDLRQKGYIFGKHYLPHDANNHNLERNESRVDRLVELGMDFNSIVVVDKSERLEDDIEATRKILPTIYIDEENCADGINALDNYQYEWDDKLGAFRPTPRPHFWANHGADAMRQFAQGWAPAPKKPKRRTPANWRTV